MYIEGLKQQFHHPLVDSRPVLQSLHCGWNVIYNYYFTISVAPTRPHYVLQFVLGTGMSFILKVLNNNFTIRRYIPYRFASLYIDKVKTVFGRFNFSKGLFLSVCIFLLLCLLPHRWGAIWSHRCLHCGCNDALFLHLCVLSQMC